MKTQQTRNNKNKSNFSGLFVKQYKDGRLKVVTDSTHTLYGKSVFINGKEFLWNTTYKCWFIDSNYKDSLFKNKAEWFSKSCEHPSQQLVGKYLYRYGGGYLLKLDPDMTDNKYFLGGYKIKTKNGYNGWFFKKNLFDDLMIHGVQFIDKDLKDVPPGDYSITPYKGGFHVKHVSGKMTPSDKYWLGGWWQPTNKAWFFKKDSIENVQKYIIGSTLKPDNDVLDSDKEYDEFAEGYFNGMNVVNHKNGYLLTPSKNHSDYGEKYYNDGFWNDTLKGWIFRKDKLEFIVNNGATLYV